VANYVAKGGKVEETVGRKCLCNALMANIGYEQRRKDGTVEPALVTIGDDLNTVVQFLSPDRDTYSAAEVVASLLSAVAEEPGVQTDSVILVSA
jgi:nitronate monooxygenase